MEINDISLILKITYPDELVDSLLISYERGLGEYRKENWQYFGNEMGQFIEVARRIIEFQLVGSYTSLTDKLRNFNEKILIEWENCDKSNIEEFRIIIPRCLYAMYCIRNKRGMIHKNHIDPNKMDASLLLGNAKWILAEIFRLASTMSFDETTMIINSIINKEVKVVWNTGKILRVLDTKMNCKNKVLCLLYMKDKQTDLELQNAIEYKNTTEFKKILKELHREKLLEYSDSYCIISPIGTQRAETMLENNDTQYVYCN